MHGSSNGPFATLLMLVPLVAVPLLAIFGVPQFTPLAASQSSDNDDLHPDRDTGLGEAARFADSSTASQGRRVRISGGAPLSGPAHRLQSRHDEIGVDPFLEDPNAPVARTHAEHAHDGQRHSEEEPRWNTEHESADGNELPRRPRPFPSSRQLSSTEAERIAASEEAALAHIDEPPADAHRVTLGNAREQLEAAASEESSREAEAAATADATLASSSPAKAVLGRPQRTPPSANRTAPKRQVENVSERIEARGPLTWKTAVHRLNSLGIQQYQLQPGLNEGDFLFCCSYSPNGNPRISRRFEAEANEPLKAVEKVLEQIDEWREESDARAER